MIDSPPTASVQRVESQRRAADPCVSTWVTANAGAGKTLVLVDRVIRLLLAGTPPQRIICLTFTRAAAAEMANRLLKQLGKWAVLDDETLRSNLSELGVETPGSVDLARARRLFASALETPGGLNIQTIHAFCEALLKRFPLEAGLPPHFEVLDERASAAMYRESIAQALEKAAKGDDPALTHACGILARRLGENRLVTVVEKACTHRYFTLLSEQERHNATIRVLGLKPDENEPALRIAACDEAAFDQPGLIEAATVLAQGTATDQQRAIIIQHWLGQTTAQRAGAGWDTYLTAFITRQEQKPHKYMATKAIREKHPAIDTILKTEQQRIMAVHERLKTIRVAESSAALTLFATHVFKQYSGEKSRRASLDFDDLITRTQTLLDQNHGVSWVMYKIDGGINHILVDESQDTSPTQWGVIHSLSREFFSGIGSHPDQRSIFTVGDEKQSIFGFQGADPEYSLNIRDELAEKLQDCGGQWSTIPLGINFRSAPAVLEVVDWVFADKAKFYGVTEEWVPHRPHRAHAAGLVEWWDLADTTDEAISDPWLPPSDQLPLTPAKQLVEDIAQHIQTMINQGERVATTGNPVQAGDILILIQKRSGNIAEDMAHALKRRGIAVAGNDRLSLADDLAIMDLCAAARFALDPEDDLNLAAVLKGPLCTPDHSLDEQDLMQLCLDRLEHNESLWATLKKQASQKTVWKTCYERLSTWLRDADRTAPYDFFTARLATENGRRALLARQGPEAEEPVDEFLTLCLAYETTYAPSLQSYLHWFQHSAGTISRAADSPRNEVRIMTVHSAKGLEAPVVFLADAARKVSKKNDFLWVPPPTDSGRNTPPENRPPVLLWPGNKLDADRTCREFNRQREQADLHEYHRLLYVAMTRAQDRLYVCGWKDQYSQSQTEKSWHAIIAPILKEKGTPIDHGDGKTAYRYETGPSLTGQSSPPIQQLQWDQPDWLYRVAPQEPSMAASLTPSARLDDSASTPGINLTRAPKSSENEAVIIARQRGLLIHRLLEILPVTPRPVQAQRMQRAAHRFAPRLPAEMIQKVFEDVLNLLNIPDIASLFTSDCLTEVPISGIVDGAMVKGRIDRLKVTATEVTILDYKSGTVPKQIPQEIPSPDLAQMALYRRLCQHLYPDRMIRCIFLWTEGPQSVIVSGEILDQAGPLSAPS